MTLIATYPRLQPAELLERQVFRTSRASQFCSETELTKQIGHPSKLWPLVLLKEAVDNGIDSAEEIGVAPEVDVRVSTETGEIVVRDNGAGIAFETVTGIVDYSVTASSRAGYIAPSRGQQGNAAKCVIAMGRALNGEPGETVIESLGDRYRLIFDVDRVRLEPKRIVPEISASDVQSGTRITVKWPSTACHLLDAAKPAFVQFAGAFTTFNPHLSLRCSWNGEEVVTVDATNRDWQKWTPRKKTSPHWYRVADLERYISSLIAWDQDHGGRVRLVRDFIAKEVRGLSRPGIQKMVLEETGTARMGLDAFFEGGSRAVGGLLEACKRYSAPVKPEALGLLGADHLLQDCCALGAAAESFKYRKHLDTTLDGLPYVLEAAFAGCPEASGRWIIAGINFSISINNPFQELGRFYDLNSLLAEQEVELDDPVVVVLHFAVPRPCFSDHGKANLTLPREAGWAAVELLKGVTKDWAKQRRREQKQESAEQRRWDNLLRQENRPAKKEKQEPVQPSDELAQVIAEAATATGMSVDDLVVPSDERDPYTSWKRRRDGEVFATLFNRLLTPGQRRHLRGLFYRCVMLPETVLWPTGKPLVNTKGNWIKFQKAASAARWLGLVPFDQIVDARNDEAKVYVPEHSEIETRVAAGSQAELPANLEAALPHIALDGFCGRQTHRIILYGEKTSLAEILQPIAMEIGTEMVLVTGESSDTRLYEALARAAADGRPVVLLYFADFDPSGHQMSISVARKVQAFRHLEFPDLDIKLYRVALTVEQVQTWDLPDKPLSSKEKRAAAWRERFGHEQTEIDAAIELAPDKLRAAVLEAIRPFYDDTLDDRVEAAERDWREKADKLLRGHPEYEACRRRIDQSFERLKIAAGKLKDEQDRGAEILKSTQPEPPECPQAAPAGTPKPALFDSDTDFVTATRRLIADKKLSGSGGDDEDGAEGEGVE